MVGGIMTGYEIPIRDDNYHVIGSTEFVDNLTLSNAPSYVNENGLVGIKRLTGGRYDGFLLYMVYDVRFPKNSYGVFITEEEAYKECLNRGRLDVAYDLGLHYPSEERMIL